MFSKAEDIDLVPDDVCEDPTADRDKVERIRARMPESMSRAAALFRILGDETRCKIVTALMREELCVHELAGIVGSSLSNVSHHLRLLRAERLVKYRRHQRRVFYSLDDEHVEILIEQVLEHVRHS